MASSSSLESLPAELLLHITSFLRFPSPPSGPPIRAQLLRVASSNPRPPPWATRMCTTPAGRLDSLTRTSRRLHAFFNPELYRYIHTDSWRVLVLLSTTLDKMNPAFGEYITEFRFNDEGRNVDHRTREPRPGAGDTLSHFNPTVLPRLQVLEYTVDDLAKGEEQWIRSWCPSYGPSEIVFTARLWDSWTPAPLVFGGGTRKLRIFRKLLGAQVAGSASMADRLPATLEILDLEVQGTHQFERARVVDVAAILREKSEKGQFKMLKKISIARLGRTGKESTVKKLTQDGVDVELHICETWPSKWWEDDGYI